MASVVFFRAVNVGGHQTFQPSRAGKELNQFDVVNIGAAGTFVVREKAGATQLREEIHRRLPFKPELMICTARDVQALMESDPFRDAPTGKDVKQYVTVLSKTLKPGPPCRSIFPRTVNGNCGSSKSPDRLWCVCDGPGKRICIPMP